MSAQYKIDAKWIFIQEWPIELKMFTNQGTMKFTWYPQKQWNAVYRSTTATGCLVNLANRSSNPSWYVSTTCYYLICLWSLSSSFHCTCNHPVLDVLQQPPCCSSTHHLCTFNDVSDNHSFTTFLLHIGLHLVSTRINISQTLSMDALSMHKSFVLRIKWWKWFF